MATTKWLSVSVLAILLNVALGNCLQMSCEYFPEPSSYTAKTSMASYALPLLGESDVTSVGQMSKRLETLKNSLKRDYDQKSVQVWIDLAKPSEDCSIALPRRSVEYHFAAVKSTFIDAKQKELLVDYLVQCNGPKLAKCAPKALETIAAAKNSEKVLEAIKFFKRVVSLDESASARELYRTLKMINLMEADWDVNFLLAEAHDYNKEEESDEVADKYHYLFVENCRKFNDKLAVPLEMLNVADVFNPSGKYFKNNDQLRSLREIGRVCLDMRRYRSGFYKNLSKKLSMKERILMPLAAKLRL